MFLIVMVQDLVVSYICKIILQTKFNYITKKQLVGESVKAKKKKLKKK